MNREEFIRQLELLLMNIPVSDRLDAISYYNDYFDDAGVENEQIVINELGSPEKVAEKIKEDLGNFDYEEPKSYSAPQDYSAPTEDDNVTGNSETYAYENYTNTTTASAPQKNKIPWPIIIIIAIFTFPLWIGIVAGAFGGIVGIAGASIGIICALFGSAIGLTIGGIGCIIAGFALLAVSPAEGLVTIGVGAILAAIGLLLGLLFAWLAFKWIPALCKVIYNWINSLFHKEEGGNEI